MRSNRDYREDKTVQIETYTEQINAFKERLIQSRKMHSNRNLYRADICVQIETTEQLIAFK